MEAIIITIPSDIWCYLIDWVANSYLDVFEDVWVRKSLALLIIRCICKSSLAGGYKYSSCLLKKWCFFNYCFKASVTHTLFRVATYFYLYPPRSTDPLSLRSPPFTSSFLDFYPYNTSRICLNRIKMEIMSYDTPSLTWVIPIIFSDKIIPRIGNGFNRSLSLVNIVPFSPPPYIKLLKKEKERDLIQEEQYELTVSFRLSAYLPYDNGNACNCWINLGFRDGKPHDVCSSYWPRGLDITFYDNGIQLAKYTDINSLGLTHEVVKDKDKDNNINNVIVKDSRVTIDIPHQRTQGLEDEILEILIRAAKATRSLIASRKIK